MGQQVYKKTKGESTRQGQFPFLENLFTRHLSPERVSSNQQGNYTMNSIDHTSQVLSSSPSNLQTAENQAELRMMGLEEFERELENDSIGPPLPEPEPEPEELLTDEEIEDCIAILRQDKQLSAYFDNDYSNTYSAQYAEQQILKRLASHFTDHRHIVQIYSESALYKMTRESEFDADRKNILNKVFAKIIKPTGLGGSKAKVLQMPIATAKGKKQSKLQADSPVLESKLAKQFIAENSAKYRWDPRRGKWFAFENNWRFDESTKAIAAIADLCDCYSDTATDDNERKRLSSYHIVSSVKKLVQIRNQIQRVEWDQDAHLLGTPGDTIDLMTGEKRPASAEDYITKQTAVAPEDGTPKVLLKFLHEATGGDVEMIDWLQKFCGYCLTGETKEGIFAFIWGPALTGKSTFLRVLEEIAGDYHTTAAVETFIDDGIERHSTDLASLAGARVVTASETEEGRSWAESKMKLITGGDKVSARFMRCDAFTFVPTFKLCIASNYQPNLKNADDAMRRRMKIIPFKNKAQKRDNDLKDALRAEYPMILQWMIDGAVKWYREGLRDSAVIANQVDQFFADQDLVKRWIEDCCNIDRNFSATPTQLADSYNDYTGENISSEKMAAKIKKIQAEYGLENGRKTIGGKKSRAWLGITIKPQDKKQEAKPEPEPEPEPEPKHCTSKKRPLFEGEDL